MVLELGCSYVLRLLRGSLRRSFGSAVTRVEVRPSFDLVAIKQQNGVPEALDGLM